MTMESGDLRIFQMVAREGSITKAAARLGYVQSNVTARIRQLEEDLKTELFFRHNRGMTLSSSGTVLLQYADQVVGLIEEAKMALASTDKPSGPLMIGSTQTTAAVRLPKLLASYYERYPDVELSLTTGHTQYVTDKVLRYELDGAFIGCHFNHPDLHSIPAFEEEAVVVTPAAVTAIEEAVKKPLLVYSTGCTYRDTLERWLHSIGTAHPVMMEFGTLEAIIGGVTAGLGITLLPRSVIAQHAALGAVQIWTIPESFSMMKTEFVTRKDSYMSSALRAFIDSFSVKKASGTSL